jgi:hypothetical protein
MTLFKQSSPKSSSRGIHNQSRACKSRETNLPLYSDFDNEFSNLLYCVSKRNSRRKLTFCQTNMYWVNLWTFYTVPSKRQWGACWFPIVCFAHELVSLRIILRYHNPLFVHLTEYTIPCSSVPWHPCMHLSGTDFNLNINTEMNE